MVKTVLETAGFVENETYRETRFLTPPRKTYAVYMDSFERGGADDANLTRSHLYTIELYSYAPDAKAEAALEAAFDALGIAFEKQGRYWLDSEQLYQIVYTFEYFEK